MMKMKLITSLFFLLSISVVKGQLVDFENLDGIIPGDPVGQLTAPNSTCSIEIFCGTDLRSTRPLTLQKVGYDAKDGGFYGVEFDTDCEGKSIQKGLSNQVNTLPYVNNPRISNRDRVGCYFISTVLKGASLPSIFIVYEGGTNSCSADLLDVDGHANTIEAYDIYYYKTKADYPADPINKLPLEIRAVGRTLGSGTLGDNGGVLPFKIESEDVFTFIEIRPIQQVDQRNNKRLEFGFALDNFSPCSVEEAKPAMIEEKNVPILKDAPPVVQEKNNEAITHSPTIQPVYFDFDSAELTEKAKETLAQLIALNKKKAITTIYLTGFTDPKGDDAYNAELSKRRVNAVKNYLIANGFSASQLNSEAKGEAYPDPTKEDWEKRAVVIRVD